MKFCPACKTEKPTEEFGKNKSRKSGLADYCLICKCAKYKEWRSQRRTFQLNSTKPVQIVPYTADGKLSIAKYGNDISYILKTLRD